MTVYLPPHLCDSRRWLVFALAVAVWIATIAGCGPPVIHEPGPEDDIHLDLPVLDSEAWVERYLPDRSSGGFNLMLYQRRVPLLTDMNGRIVHNENVPAAYQIYQLEVDRLNRGIYMIQWYEGNVLKGRNKLITVD